MEKQVSIVVAASGEIKDIGLSPGATVSEVMTEADLQGYQLTRKGGELLAPNADLYEEAHDSEKLYATPEDVSVGAGGSASLSKFKAFIKLVINFLNKTIDDDIGRERITIRSKKKASGLFEFGSLILRGSPKRVETEGQGYWDLKARSLTGKRADGGKQMEHWRGITKHPTEDGKGL